VVGESRAELGGKALLVPAGVALRSEKDGALVVVDAVDLPAEPGEMDADFGADEAGGTGDEDGEVRCLAAGRLFLVRCFRFLIPDF
jgi:hypothetical protein